MGKKFVNFVCFIEFIYKVKVMVCGEEVMYGECEKLVKFFWVDGYELFVWVVVYGFKVFVVVGEYGDGVIL